MTAYLQLTPNIMATSETVSTPSGDKISINLAVEPHKRTHRLSFTKEPETPPITPPNEEANHNQDELLLSRTMLKESLKEEATPAPTDGYQDTVATGPTVEVPKIASPSTSLSPATRLKHRLQKETGLMVCPGVYDGLSARIAMDVGFETLYMVCTPRNFPFPNHS